MRSKKRKKRSNGTAWKWPFRSKGGKAVLPLAWIGAGWALALFGILALLNFHPIVKTEAGLTSSPWLIWPFLAAGLACMVFGYRNLPTADYPDVSRTAAGVWMAILFGVGAFLRLYRVGTPPGPFWDDWATILVWVHNVLDKNIFYWMFPSDGIEPFVPYVITALQAVLPDEVKDFMVRRFASCLIDTGALWVLYLAGKELGSRRIGLIAMALGAIGRPMLQLSVTGMRAYSLSLAVGFLILASLKLFRKPSLAHFLLWGFALAFGVHTYSSYRCFMLIVPFLVFPWIFSDPKKKNLHPSAWLAAVGSTFLLLGVYSGTFAITAPQLSFWSDRWNGWVSRPWVISSLFLLALSPGIYSLWAERRKKGISRLAGWSLAVGFASLVVFPLTLSEEFNGRMGVLSPFRDGKTVQNLFGFFAGNVWQTLKSLFYFCVDRNDLTIATDPFFDYFSQGALVLGLAFLIARPDRRKGFLLALAALGTLVYVISFDPASTKLISSAPPLYLLSAWALARLWAALPRLAPPKRFSLPVLLFTSLFVVYGLWGIKIQIEKIYGYWAKIPMVDTELAKLVAKDEPLYRVYLVPSDWFFGWSAQFVLEEGRRYYILKETNSIPVQKGEKPEDVVLFVYGSNEKMIQVLHAQFPAAQWEKYFVFPHKEGDPNPELYLWRVFIPGIDIPFDPHYVLFRHEENGPWLRRYYNHEYGWGLPGVLRETRVENFSDPIPSDWLNSKVFEKFQYARLAQFLGTIQPEADGDYVWRIDFPDPIWFRIDGKTVWKRDTPGDEKSKLIKVHLLAGIHQIEVRLRFPFHYQAPIIHWMGPGAGAGKDL